MKCVHSDRSSRSAGPLIRHARHAGTRRPGAAIRNRSFKLRMAVILLCLSAAAIFSIPLVDTLHTLAAREENHPAGFTVISPLAWDELTAAGTEVPMEPSAVLYDGAPVSYVDAAYTATGCTYYVPQNPDTAVWDGRFTAGPGARLYILEDEALSEKAAALQEGHVFTCLYVSGETFSTFSLIMTGLPTVSIEYDNTSPLTSEGEEHDALVCLREADGSYTVSACTIHVRGAFSRGFDKKSYKISLKNADGSNNALSLLGMRSDDDWILNGLYMDETKTHEVLGYRIWDEILSLSGRAEQTAQLQYAEVFLNNEYTGLYALMEPVDAKTFALQEDDVLYKIQNNTHDDNVKATWPGGLTRFNGQAEIDGARILWPKTTEGYQWDLLEDCYRFIEGELSLEELTEKGVVLDTESIANYELLVVLTCASDNTWKNSFLVCSARADGTFLVGESPWDLNGTWGGDYAANFRAETAGDPDYVHSGLWYAWQRDDPDAAWETVCSAWRTLRDGGLCAESVCGEAEMLWGDLLQSGAIFREADLFPGHVDGNNYYEMQEWIRVRFETLDEYYGYQE